MKPYTNIIEAHTVSFKCVNLTTVEHIL